MKFQTDCGETRVESSGESFFLVTLRMDSQSPYEIYVAAYDAREAAQKAFKFWYGHNSKKLTLI